MSLPGRSAETRRSSNLRLPITKLGRSAVRRCSGWGFVTPPSSSSLAAYERYQKRLLLYEIGVRRIVARRIIVLRAFGLADLSPFHVVEKWLSAGCAYLASCGNGLSAGAASQVKPQRKDSAFIAVRTWVAGHGLTSYSGP